MTRDLPHVRWLVPLLFLLTLASLLAVAGPFGGTSANAQGAHDFSDLEHADRYTAPGTQANWPPRPIGATSALREVQGPPTGDNAGNLTWQAVANNSNEMRAALGSDWDHISSAPARDGKGGYQGAEFVFFSRSNNHTVIAIENQAGGLEVDTVDASIFQPVLNDKDVSDAATIGRSWLVANGFPEVASLEGYAIRALENGDFHSVRMAYVTFATEPFADPTHSALVDLTNMTAVSGREL